MADGDPIISEAASRGREVKQHWAVPGSQHDRVIRIAKIGLPIAVGILIALLALAPLDRSGDVSFILDKNKVENAPERMRVDVARYTGEDNQGRPFLIMAKSAIQRSSDLPIVDITGMLAKLWLPDGAITLVADFARYNLDEQKVRVIGPIRVSGPNGYRLQTSDVQVDLKQRKVTGSGGVQGQMKLGEFRAGRMTADLGQRTVTLDHGARLKIVQGAVR
ncbi:MAG TPA: LPS export ABC transporter periplasmic protein LptC [Sphingomicrobium sp.]|jgi:lipopolysaccharide export system protein LptC|nr:LPS export ABC transporter periplasmic protein LptC [Sphingomicrobium sp.]